ncbi:hypothetical protein [Providencia sp. PROV255]|uniref:hypothetical protein n=1 Tax=Providencia sp. PROV255 TaxID=2949943 RepID=UPI00234AA17E|nr:hypothetical protein [Providencia sp. PROV255]
MKKLNIIALALATCTVTFGASAAIGSGQSQPFDANQPSVVLVQQKEPVVVMAVLRVTQVLVCNLFMVEKPFLSQA